ncbi:MAG: DUF4468 domain-containing protein [Oligoflexia bacterium]|nr:DUF4468 domain-containing protein [Oligoflexia bacterium]
MIKNTRILFFTLLFCSLLTTHFVKAEDKAKEEGLKNEFSKVHEIPKLKKDQIYEKARQWFSESFVSGKEVVDYGNKEEGTIIGNGEAKTGMAFIVEQWVKFRLRVDIKDGRYKTTVKFIERFQKDTNGQYNTPNVSKARNKEEIETLEKMIDDLKKYIASEESPKKDNW